MPEDRGNGNGRPAGEAAWEPRIVCFFCNWCTYLAADLAGTSRMKYAPNARVIRVMCSGRIHPAFVLRAFEQGADGVLVSGCHFGDCHYMFGNERALEQFDKTMKVVTLLGIEPGRLRLEWISAAEGNRFAAVIDEFTDQVGELLSGELQQIERGKLVVMLNRSKDADAIIPWKEQNPRERFRQGDPIRAVLKKLEERLAPAERG